MLNYYQNDSIMFLIVLIGTIHIYTPIKSQMIEGMYFAFTF